VILFERGLLLHDPGTGRGQCSVCTLAAAVATTLSSAMSALGLVMIRGGNPLPAAPVVVATVCSP
jgi:hypothetical protein